jgi:mannose-6-phosphate isomerase
MLPPLAFRPILKARAWGSTRLRSLGKPVSADARIGESWELADLPDSIADGQSTIAGGRFDGVRLRDLRLAHRDELLGVTTPAPDGAFPLLVKFLDAAEHLSVQLHPDAAFVRAHRDAHLKTEAWVVLDATPGAVLFRGFRPAVTLGDYERALGEGAVVDLLEAIEVRRGDCVYLPSGICHALGAGVIAAEIQTPSDTTFRVWDWSRDDPARPLHLEEARACLRFGADQFDGFPPIVRGESAPTLAAHGFLTKQLARNPFFRIEWIEATRPGSMPIEPSGVAEVWMTVAGNARWRTTSGEQSAPVGATILRPAAVEPGEVLIDAGTVIVRTHCGSPLDGAIATQ